MPKDVKINKSRKKKPSKGAPEKVLIPLSTKIPLYCGDVAMLKQRVQGASFNEWWKLKQKYEDEGEDDVALYCERSAYFDCQDLHHGLYMFLQNVICATMRPNRLDPGPHGQACKHIVPSRDISASTGNGLRKLYYASRGTFKSTVVSTGYACWRIGREYCLTGENLLRIAFASEKLEMAERNVGSVRQIFELNAEYKRLCGTHRPDRTKYDTADDFRRSWSKSALKSRFRVEPLIFEPTIGRISIKAPLPGHHFDIIIADDVQAENTSYSFEQIETCWNFFELLDRVLVQDGSGEKVVLGTRWGNDDLLSRIEEQNERIPEDARYGMLIIPGREGDPQSGKINFPTIHTSTYLENEYRKNRRHYMNQIMLQPVADEDMPIRKEMIQYWDELPKDLVIFTSADFAFTEISAARQRQFSGYQKIDYTVVMTWGIDAMWRYYCIDWWRDRCSKNEAIKQVFEQTRQYHPRRVVLQKYDRAQMAEAFEQRSRLTGVYPPLEWISYPPQQKKKDRLDVSCIPLFEEHRVYLRSDMDWFVNEELLRYPECRHFDGMDTMGNVMWVSNPALMGEEIVKVSPEQIRVEELMGGSSSTKDWRQM